MNEIMEMNRWSRRQRGFTLIELMIVVAIVATVAAIAIPSLLGARKAGNEAVAISSLRTLTTVNEQYRTRFQNYASTLANLSATRYIDNKLGSGNKSGYSYGYAGGLNTWSCAADPTINGETGDRHFFIDQTGVIRFTSSGSATSASPSLD